VILCTVIYLTMFLYTEKHKIVDKPHFHLRIFAKILRILVCLLRKSLRKFTKIKCFAKIDAKTKSFRENLLNFGLVYVFRENE
jgi:hypothetical protein